MCTPTTPHSQGVVRRLFPSASLSPPKRFQEPKRGAPGARRENKNGCHVLQHSTFHCRFLVLQSQVHVPHLQVGSATFHIIRTLSVPHQSCTTMACILRVQATSILKMSKASSSFVLSQQGFVASAYFLASTAQYLSRMTPVLQK